MTADHLVAQGHLPVKLQHLVQSQIALAVALLLRQLDAHLRTDDVLQRLGQHHLHAKQADGGNGLEQERRELTHGEDDRCCPLAVDIHLQALDERGQQRQFFQNLEPLCGHLLVMQDVFQQHGLTIVVDGYIEGKLSELVLRDQQRRTKFTFREEEAVEPRTDGTWGGFLADAIERIDVVLKENCEYRTFLCMVAQYVYQTVY